MFNPLKHYLTFIREFVSNHSLTMKNSGIKDLSIELKHLGTSVMDIYTGELSLEQIFTEFMEFLKTHKLNERELYKEWVCKSFDDYRLIKLSDSSQWTLKYHNHETRYVHVFPARFSPRSFRIKSNTLKSAIMYIILIGRDYVSENDLNAARTLVGLSPVREVADAEGVTEMIEIIRNQ